jgi:hypothetical protein
MRKQADFRRVILCETIVELERNEETAKEQGESRVCIFSQAQQYMERNRFFQM